MAEKNGNGEKRWLTWLVRVILPALVAAMWLNLAGEIDELRDDVREMRGEVRDEMKSQRLVNREQDGCLARLDTEVGLLRDDGRGD